MRIFPVEADCNYFLFIVSAVESYRNMVSSAVKPSISINLPLRGIWVTPNSPGKKIPSHGIDGCGETYAYDFVGVDPGKQTDKFYSVSVISYLFNGVPLQKCHGWGEKVFAPFDGEIVRVEDGVAERNPVVLNRDIRYAREITKRFKSGKVTYKEVAGNHIILKQSEEMYALFAHLQTNSLRVKTGERVKSGQHIGNVGHSGNSTAPHLHFQLMDHIDPVKSRGIFCGFSEYEEFKNGTWNNVVDGIPSGYRIRWLA